MRGSTPARHPGVARLWAVSAVLLGLFLTHGAPATAVDGCHGAMGMAVTADVSHTAPAVPEQAVSSRPAADRTLAASDVGPRGTPCVAVPASADIPVPVAPLVGVAALAALAAGALGWAWDPDGTRRRGPPGGRRLLAELPTAGDWRLFLQFRTGGRLHTAALTLRVG
ncbi:hypothetical protein [Streptomyces collinus]|uniref:hypothetical protein n=1 Tax=Streptomyces collinus TaxID=42684 RepID=UPI00363E1168